MRVKVKDPRVVVYCPQQAKVVSGKDPVEVVYTQAIRDAFRDGLIIEVTEEAKAEEAKVEEKPKTEAEKKADIAKLAETAKKTAAVKKTTAKKNAN